MAAENGAEFENGAEVSGAAPPRSAWRFSRGDAIVVVVALVLRAFVLLWAAGRFGATADGVYYHTIGTRIAAGLGSTWLWPDGVVTFAAHYPVGYPALLALAYLVGGPSTTAGGVVNALWGMLAALAAYRLARESSREAWARAAGLAVALHPALVMYTPALMTEGVTAAIVVCAAWAASRRSRAGIVVLGLLLGIGTLVRPQTLLLAPLLGAIAVPHGARVRERLRRAAVATCLALLVCLPWTARNCVRMHRCALVSVNGGWNLLIGSHPGANGTYAPLEVPEACRTVWDEAEKDACFGREARRFIAADPVRFLRLVPARLAATFDYSGAPGFYLHQSNPDVFDDRAKLALGVIETAYERLAYLGALFVAAAAAGPYRRTRWGLALLSGALLFQTHAYLAVLGLVGVLALRERRLASAPLLDVATLVTLVATVATHAVFFGSGRYSMVVFPLVTALAFAHGRSEERPTLVLSQSAFVRTVRAYFDSTGRRGRY